MTLSQSQLRLISSIGVGVLVGTSLIVIIPEGIETAVTPAEASHLHKVRSLVRRSPWALGIEPRDIIETFPVVRTTAPRDTIQSSDLASISPRIEVPQSYQAVKRQDDEEEQPQEPPSLLRSRKNTNTKKTKQSTRTVMRFQRWKLDSP